MSFTIVVVFILCLTFGFMNHIYPCYSNNEFLLYDFVATRISFGCSLSPLYFICSVQASTVTTSLQQLLSLLSVIHGIRCYLYLYPPQNEVLWGYTVFSLSVIPSFRHSVNILTTLLNNLSSFCLIHFKFSPHLRH